MEFLLRNETLRLILLNRAQVRYDVSFLTRARLGDFCMGISCTSQIRYCCPSKKKPILKRCKKRKYKRMNNQTLQKRGLLFLDSSRHEQERLLGAMEKPTTSLEISRGSKGKRRTHRLDTGAACGSLQRDPPHAHLSPLRPHTRTPYTSCIRGWSCTHRPPGPSLTSRQTMSHHTTQRI